MTILRKGWGRKRFYGILSFFDGFLQSIFFNGLAGFYGGRLEGVCYLLSKSSVLLLHPEFWRQCQHILSHQPLSSYFRCRKGCYFRFRVLANHLASPFFFHPVRRFVRTTICPYTPFFIHLVTECNITWLSFWPGFVTSAARNWPTFLIPLLTVSPWWPVNSNTGG